VWASGTLDATTPKEIAPIPRKRPHIPTPAERPDDEGTVREARPRSTKARQERAFLVAVDSGPRPGAMTTEESLQELARLVRTAGGWVSGSTSQRRPHPDPAYYVGTGKVEEIAAAQAETDYSMVVFDDALSPSQQFNLEQALGTKIYDRSALILDIFARRARTREASLQVELAQHEYLLPRLRGQWQHLERMEGAINSRGPGETQLETDRRLIGTRISRLKKQIDQVRRQRELQRSRRQRQGLPVVALVGYTNAGKSSLMRSLAGAQVFVADAVFATLDPVTRRLGEGTEALLLTDTVGFMQKLPTQLVSAFRATLEELGQADLLLHVVDATASTRDAQVATVLETLRELGQSDLPVLTVLNKADGLVLPDGSPVETEADIATLSKLRLPGIEGEMIYTSATAGLGVDKLRKRLFYEFFGDPATRNVPEYAASS